MANTKKPTAPKRASKGKRHPLTAETLDRMADDFAHQPADAPVVNPVSQDGRLPQTYEFRLDLRTTDTISSRLLKKSLEHSL